MTFKEQDVSRFLEIFKQSKSKIEDFPGCKKVELLQDCDHPEVYITHSHWLGAGDLENYRQSELFKGVWAQTKPLFAARPQAFSMKKANV